MRLQIYFYVVTKFMRFQVLTVVLLRIQVFWDVALCCWVSGSQHLKGTWCLHRQGSSRAWRILLGSFETSRNTHPSTQCHTPEEFKLL